MLGIELWSFERTASDLNFWVVSPALNRIFIPLSLRDHSTEGGEKLYKQERRERRAMKLSLLGNSAVMTSEWLWSHPIGVFKTAPTTVNYGSGRGLQCSTWIINHWQILEEEAIVLSYVSAEVPTQLSDWFQTQTILVSSVGSHTEFKKGGQKGVRWTGVALESERMGHSTHCIQVWNC